MKKYSTQEVLKFMLRHNLDLKKFAKIVDIDEDRVRLHLFNGFNLKPEEKLTIDTAIRILESQNLVNKDEFEDDWTWEDEQLFIRSVHADVVKERRECEDAAEEILFVVMPLDDTIFRDANCYTDLAGMVGQKYCRREAEKRIRKEVQRMVRYFY